MPSRMLSRRQRVPVYPVRKWFPGKGSAFVAPSVRIFYSTRIRANLLWWKQEKAPRQVLSCLKNGVRLSFHRPPPPLHASPLLVQNKDVEFVIQDLSKGDSLGSTSRCGLKAPTFSAERAFIRKRAESSEWYTITVI